MVLRVRTDLSTFFPDYEVLAETKYGRIEIINNQLFINVEHTYMYDFNIHCWYKFVHNSPIKQIEAPMIQLDILTLELKVVSNRFFEIVYTDDDTIDEYYRVVRAAVCFPIINRGPLWYQHLTLSQQTDLNTWYEEWLDAPETHVYPRSLPWLNDKLQKIELEEIF